MGNSIRLDKYISDAGAFTRSQARQLIKKGRVMVNNQLEKKPERKLDPVTDEVRLDGVVCHYEEYIYLMLNKPQGFVSATEDGRDKTVIECVDKRGHSIFPVGRLDKDTEGLLLLTDDGNLAHELLSPKKHVDKCYYAILDKKPEDEDIEAVRNGLDIGDEKKTMPAVLELLEPSAKVPEGYPVRITIREGRFHQIKRMAHALGANVLYLKRVSMGPLKLDPALKPGDYRPLTEEELASLKKLTNL